MLSSVVPPDVWCIIREHIHKPTLHITLSQVCQTSRAIYEGEQKWQQLCRAIGVGRAIGEKNESWKNVFVEVLAHRKGCKVPACYQYGVPPTDVIGDLLPSPQAVLEHAAYFTKEAPADCVCPHAFPGHGIFSGNDGGVDTGYEGIMGTDDDDSDDSEGEGEGEADPALPGPANPGAPPHAAPQPAFGPGLGLGGTAGLTIDPNALMASFFTLMGIAPPPAGTFNPVPVAGLPAGSAFLFPTVLSLNGGQPATAGVGTDPAVDLSTADPDVPALPTPPAPPPIVPRLLPLSLKNREKVPAGPQLHPFLVDTGLVQFERFLAGKTTTNQHPTVLGRDGHGQTPVGIDWDDDEAGGDWESRCLVDVGDHSLLQRAFATNPPVSELHFKIEHFSFRVINKDGVIIKDVIHNMSRYLDKPLSMADRALLCPEEGSPEHVCDLAKYKNRLDYLYRHCRQPGLDSLAGLGFLAQLAPVKVTEIWLRGILRFKDGQAICVMCP